MEQGILDGSKYKLTLISLDTRFADTLGVGKSEFRQSAPQPLKNIARVRLASAEIPLSEHVFSEKKGNLSFQITYQGTTTTLSIAAGNYTPTTLVAAVQTALKTVSNQFTCVIDSISGFCVITHPAHTFQLLFTSSVSGIAGRQTFWGLGYYLGFREKVVDARVVGGDYVATGVSPPTTRATPYYLLRLKCAEEVFSVQHRIEKGGFLQAFAKLMLKGDVYDVQFDDNSNLLRKEFTFLSPVTIPFFSVQLVDPWGEAVDMLESDWSITLELTEIVNSKTYDTMLKTYDRY
jgi:hypothetical protein